jgi:hypothetical protein
MWFFGNISVGRWTRDADRHVLCPSCGLRPRWAATVTKNDEVVERTWWCPGCFAFIKAAPLENVLPHVFDRFVDVPLGHLN